MLLLMQLSVPLEQLVLVGLFVCHCILLKIKVAVYNTNCIVLIFGVHGALQSHVTSDCMQTRGRIGKLNETYLEVEV